MGARDAVLSLMRCRSCGGDVASVGPLCTANDTCASCIAEIHAAESLGHRVLCDAEEAELTAVGGASAHGYGELTPLGFKQLCERLRLNEQDTFVDLGSGGGRVVLQAAREYGVQRSVGIELAQTRHELAERNLAREPHIAERVRFVCGNIADSRHWTRRRVGETADNDGVLVGVTVVYLSSLLFNEELMEAMARRIEACDTVRVVATLRRFSRRPDGCELRGFHFRLPTERCETSWMIPRHVENPLELDHPGSPMYIYERGAPSPASADALIQEARQWRASDLETSLHALTAKLDDAVSHAHRFRASLQAACDRLDGHVDSGHVDSTSTDEPAGAALTAAAPRGACGDANEAASWVEHIQHFLDLSPNHSPKLRHRVFQVVTRGAPIPPAMRMALPPLPSGQRLDMCNGVPQKAPPPCELSPALDASSIDDVAYLESVWSQIDRAVDEQVADDYVTGTAGEVWPAAVALCAWLSAHAQSVRGKRVLELGAGMGACGLFAAALGATRVLITDLAYESATYREACQANIDANRRLFAAGARVEMAALSWVPAEEQAEAPAAATHAAMEGVDLVLVSDCTFDQYHLDGLCALLAGLLHHAPPPRVVLSHEHRYRGPTTGDGLRGMPALRTHLESWDDGDETLAIFRSVAEPLGLKLTPALWAERPIALDVAGFRWWSADISIVGVELEKGIS